MKCTKNYNARVEPLFSSLNLLFSDVPVAVAVVVFLNSLLYIVLRSDTASWDLGQEKVTVLVNKKVSEWRETSK